MHHTSACAISSPWGTNNGRIIHLHLHRNKCMSSARTLISLPTFLSTAMSTFSATAAATLHPPFSLCSGDSQYGWSPSLLPCVVQPSSLVDQTPMNSHSNNKQQISRRMNILRQAVLEYTHGHGIHRGHALLLVGRKYYCRWQKNTTVTDKSQNQGISYRSTKRERRKLGGKIEQH